jgi:hypothetical protein
MKMELISVEDEAGLVFEAENAAEKHQMLWLTSELSKKGVRCNFWNDMDGSKGITIRLKKDHKQN